MKLKLPLIAVFIGALSLTACGGGSSGNSGVSVSSPASLVSTDLVVGTGATVANGTAVTINYTVNLYVENTTDHKGVQVDAGTYSFTPPNQVITGVATGIIGMKVGGRRVLLIPSSQAYGPAGYGSIPPNSGIVFDMTLTAAK